MIREATRRRPADRPEASDSVGIAVLGAGPAGLTAGYVLATRGRPGVVYEADTAVGGIARTVRRGSYRFDLGGQVFCTDVPVVERLWLSLLGEELIRRPRLARVRCRRGYVAYPPQARELAVLLGVSGSDTETQQAVRRITTYSAQRSPFDKMNRRHGGGTTLIEEYQYPRLGPGQMWEAAHDFLDGAGIPVRLEHRSVAVRHADGHVTSVVLRSGGKYLESQVEGVLSSLPVGALVSGFSPEPPTEVREAAARLRHRSMALVALMTDESEPFPDNWIDLQDPRIRASRVQNFGAWSEDMVVSGTTCLGVEYPCRADDEIWRLDERDAIELAKRELGAIGLIDPSSVFDGMRVRVARAYPVRDAEQLGALMVLREYLAGFENLETFGRNGLHCPNTQDHSVLSAVLATLNLLEGASHDVWAVNGAATGRRADAGGGATAEREPFTLGVPLGRRA